jgi:hypothetical protein
MTNWIKCFCFSDTLIPFNNFRKFGTASKPQGNSGLRKTLEEWNDYMKKQWSPSVSILIQSVYKKLFQAYLSGVTVCTRPHTVECTKIFTVMLVTLWMPNSYLRNIEHPKLLKENYRKKKLNYTWRSKFWFNFINANTAVLTFLSQLHCWYM